MTTLLTWCGCERVVGNSRAGRRMELPASPSMRSPILRDKPGLGRRALWNSEPKRHRLAPLVPFPDDSDGLDPQCGTSCPESAHFGRCGRLVHRLMSCLRLLPWWRGGPVEESLPTKKTPRNQKGPSSLGALSGSVVFLIGSGGVRLGGHSEKPHKG